jgi:hypothetical protein
MIFPETIYETPSNEHSDWGEQIYASKTAMQNIIREYRKMGDDWKRCHISDCSTLQFQTAISATRALYRKTWSQTESGKWHHYTRFYELAITHGQFPAYNVVAIYYEYPDGVEWVNPAYKY